MKSHGEVLRLSKKKKRYLSSSWKLHPTGIFSSSHYLTETA